MTPPAVGSLVVLDLEGQEVVGEVARVTPDQVAVLVKIPHDTASMFPPTGSVTWPDGRVQDFSRSQARAVTLVEVVLPLSEADAGGRLAEIHLKRRVAVDVRDLEGRLVANGHTFTLSTAGAKLDLKRPLAPSTRYRVAMYLPDGLLKLDVQALQNDASGKAIVTFQDVSAPSRERLNHFLKEGLRILKARRKGPEGPNG